MQLVLCLLCDWPHSPWQDSHFLRVSISSKFQMFTHWDKKVENHCSIRSLFPAAVRNRNQSSAPPVQLMPSDQMKEWGMSLSAVLYKSSSPCRFAEIKLSISLILTITVLPWLTTIFTNYFSWIFIGNKGIYCTRWKALYLMKGSLYILENVRFMVGIFLQVHV